MSIDSLEKMLGEELRDLYDAEKRLTKALPKLAKKAQHDDLRMALENHLMETETQVERLEQCLEMMELPVRGKTCAGMQGIIEEGNEHVGEDFEDDSLRDAMIIAAAQKTEHYEIASYGTAAAHAKIIGRKDIAQLLVETLDEEKAADEKLNALAESIVNPSAAEMVAQGNGSSSRKSGKKR